MVTLVDFSWPLQERKQHQSDRSYHVKPKGMLITNCLSMARYSSTCVSRAIFNSFELQRTKAQTAFCRENMFLWVLEFNLHFCPCTWIFQLLLVTKSRQVVTVISGLPYTDWAARLMIIIIIITLWNWYILRYYKTCSRKVLFTILNKPSPHWVRGLVCK